MEYVDYRRYADGVRPTGSYAIDGARGGTRRGLALAQGTALAIATPAPKTAAGAGEDADAELPTSKRLPVWWLFFLPLYWFPQGINFGLIQTVSRLPLIGSIIYPLIDPKFTSNPPLLVILGPFWP
jgi:hypothetical protein